MINCRPFIFLLALLLWGQSASAALTDNNVKIASNSGQYDLTMHFSEDELVETASRYAKPISQVAENITVITAKEIAAMHVHTVAEVLEQVAGSTITFYGHDFGSNAHLNIQGANTWQTLVLIDGVRYNNTSGGDGLTNGIPLQIIKRIEFIKGPASSVWGSSLGGVVNIITKDAGGTLRPHGNVAASYGEAASWVMETDVFGQMDAMGYYLYGGTHNSDGLWNDRNFDNDPIYGKLKIELPRDMELLFSMGHSSPKYKTGEFPDFDVTQNLSNRSTFASLSLDVPLKKQFNLYLAGQTFRQNFIDDRDVMGLGLEVSGNGNQYSDAVWDEKTFSLEGRLTWWTENLSAVLGAETSRSEMDYTFDWGLLKWGGPTSLVSPRAYEEKRGVFGNFTWRWQDLTVTPGIRYDYHSISDEFISPSVGVTYLISDTNLVRASVSRGFSYPALALISGGNIWESVNPDLEPEKIWAYQIGLENTSLDLLRIKINLFEHKIANVFKGPAPWSNKGKERRRGAEIDLQSSSWHQFSAAANFTFSQLDNAGRDNDQSYNGNVLLNYDDLKSWSARLSGHYVWYFDSFTAGRQSSNDMIWELSVNREFRLVDSIESELFMVVHNVFDGRQYWDSDYQNPGRWLEVGIKVSY